MKLKSFVKKEPLEKDVERKFVLAVKAKGGKAYKFTSPMNRSVTDRLVIFPGQVWFVEIKRSSGKLTVLQKSFRQKIKNFNLNYFLVRDNKTMQDFFKEVFYDRSPKIKDISA